MTRPALLAVAFSPRAAMRRLLDRGPSRRREIMALVLAAFLSSVAKDVRTVELDQPAVWLVPVTIALSALAAVGVFYLFAWGAAFAGRLVDGTGTAAQIRTALAWGFAPLILALLYRLPMMFLAPRKVVFRAADFTASTPPLLIVGVLDLLVLVWYLIVGGITLSEAQGVSSWAGLGNLLLAWILPFVSIGAVVLAAVLTPYFNPSAT
ncbi:MAG TPA: YIP1 family protein [Thermoanaerobaculia bacterium]|nr:YIP1 family protein [Thermoanaerobaculia bacterium]